MQRNIENIEITAIKHVEINQISALNDRYGFGMKRIIPLKSIDRSPSLLSRT